MRRDTFPIQDHLALITIDLVHVAFFVHNYLHYALVFCRTICRVRRNCCSINWTFLFPILLPFIPTKDILMKRFILREIIAGH